MTITKEAYNRAVDNNKPNGWTKLMFRYFSQSTVEEDLKPSKTLGATLISLFLLGFLGTALELDHATLGIFTITYAVGVTAIVSSMFSAVIMNNIRIKKIAKELGVNLEQYEKLTITYNKK